MKTNNRKINGTTALVGVQNFEPCRLVPENKFTPQNDGLTTSKRAQNFVPLPALRNLIGIITVIFIACTTLKAQSNLQFNAVKYITLRGTANSGWGTSGAALIDTAQTIKIVVPTNKVWKIESASVNDILYTPQPNGYNNGNLTYDTAIIQAPPAGYNSVNSPVDIGSNVGYGAILIGGTMICGANYFNPLQNANYFNPTATYNYIGNPLPLWLPSGTYTLTLRGLSGNTYSGYISAIEYNLVP